MVNAAQAAGRELSAREALDVSCELSTLDFRSKQAGNVARVMPPLAPLPPFADGLWEEQQEKSPAWVRSSWSWYPTQFPLFRNVQLKNASEWWVHYYYALVDLDLRRIHPNYENRIRNATMTVLPCSDLVAYYSPGVQRN